LTEIDIFVSEYLTSHPDHELPANGMRHTAVLACVGEIKRSLMDHYGGPLPYWQAILRSARIWFQPGDRSAEFRLFKLLFEGEGNIWWGGLPEFDPLDREYNEWRISLIKHRPGSS